MGKSSPIAALWCLAGAGLALAQQPATPEFRASSELVLVDVVVIDKEGRPVGGLTKDDFVVSDEGKPQSLASFQAVALAGTTAPALPAPIEGVATNASAGRDEGRVFLLAFDDNHLSAVTASAVRKGVAQFLDRLRAGDHVWLVPTSGGSGYQATLPQGKAGLLATLETLQGKRPNVVSASHISDWEAMRAMRRDEAVIAQLRKRLLDFETQTDVRERMSPSGASETDQATKDALMSDSPALLTGRITAEATSIYNAALNRRTATFQALAQDLDRLSSFPGRKSLLLLSEGFIDEPDGARRKELVDASQRTNVALYFIDARGLAGGAWTAQADLNRAVDERDVGSVAEDFNRIAAGADSVALDTGGFTLRNTNDIAGGLDRIARESESYYLLGYEPPAGAREGTFRKISVSVKREGLELRARKGYYARAAQTAAVASSARLRAAADAPFDAGAVPLRLASYVQGPAPSAAGRTSVLLEAELDPAGLGSTVETLAVVVPETGEPVRKERTLPVKATRTDPQGSPWAGLEQEFALAPGSYEARFVVRDPQSGRVGSVRQRLVVPDVESLRTSTPVLTDLLEEVQGGQLPVMLARRHFAPGTKLFGMFEVFGAASSPQGPKVTVGYALRGTDGKAVATKPPSPLPPGPEGDLTQTLVVPLEKIPQGRYELVLQIRDEVAGKTLERTESFVVGDPAAVAKMVVAAAATPGGVRNAAGYLGLVAAYRKGDLASAAALSAWTLAELKPALDAARGGQGCDDTCRRAAALLHLEAGLAAEDRGDATLASAHMVAGRQLLEKTKDEAFRAQWMLAVGYELLGAARLREAEAALDESVKAGNPEALLALGAIWDFRSTLDSIPPGTSFQATASGSQALPQFQLKAFREQSLGKAEDLYRRALKARPELTEARLRLGRILLRRDKPELAEPELTAAAASADPMVKVLALLFLGEASETRGRLPDAIASYKAALTANPRSQAARMALSYALARAGDRGAAAALVRDATTATPVTDEPMDGWLAYHLGPSRHLDDVVKAMREGVRS